MSTTIEPHSDALAPTEGSPAETYDFLRPQRISKEQWAALQTVCTRLVAALQAVLVTRLRQPVVVSLGRVEEVTTGEGVKTLATPCAAYVFDPGDGSGTFGVLDLGTALASYIVDRLLGGPGAALDATRAPTELEQRVLKSVVERALAAVGDVLKDHMRVKPSLTGCHDVPDQLAAAVGADALLLATFDVATEKPVGTLTLCMPLPALSAFFQDQRNAGPRSGKTAPAVRPDTRALVEAAIRRAHVPVMVRFPAITLPARAVAALAPGQTIQTALPLNVPVEVRVNGRLRFVGAAGQIHGTVGVRIVRTVAPDASGPTAPTRARIL